MNYEGTLSEIVAYLSEDVDAATEMIDRIRMDDLGTGGSDLKETDAHLRVAILALRRIADELRTAAKQNERAA